MSPSSKLFLFDMPGSYLIRVQGELSTNWSSRFSDMVITQNETADQESVMTLTGEVRDQAALLGVLNMLYDLGCPLLNVERLDDVPTAEDLEPTEVDTESNLLTTE